MYLRRGLDEYHLGKLCKELSKKSKSFIETNLADDEHQVFMVNSDGKLFDVTYACVYTLGRVADSDAMQRFIGENLSEEQIEALLNSIYNPRIIKAKSKKQSKREKKNKKEKTDTRCNNIDVKDNIEWMTIHTMMDSGASIMISSLVDVIKEPSKVIVDLLSEAMHTALYTMWAEDYGSILPTFAHFQCTLLYYWMYKNNPCIATYIEEKESAKNKAKKKNWESKQREHIFATEYRKEIGENETLEEFIARVFDDEQVAKFAIKYLNACTYSYTLGVTEYILITEYMSTMMEYRKRNKRLDDFINEVVSTMGEKTGLFEFSKVGVWLLEHLGMTRDEIALGGLSTSIIIDSVILICEAGGAYAYLYYLHNRDNVEHDKSVYMEYLNHLGLMLYQRYNLARHDFVMISASQYNRILDSKRKALEDKDKSDFRISQLEKLNQELKGKVKGIKKELDSEKALRNQINTELTQYKNRDKLGLTMSDYEDLRNQVKALQEKLDKQLDENLDTRRILAKRDRELEQLREDIDSHKDTIKDLEKANEAKTEADENLDTIRRYNRIPIDNFVNVINRYRVTLIGGDPIFNQIKDRGLTSIKCVSTTKNTVTAEELIGSDIIVIATFYVDHPTTYAATNIAKTNNIRLLRCNNKNVDMLIYDIFEELTKRSD